MIKTHTFKTKVAANGQCYKLVSHKRGICCHPSIDCASTFSVVKVDTLNRHRDPSRLEIRKGLVWCDEYSDEAFDFFEAAGEPEE